MSSLLTENLRNELESTTASFNKWADKQADYLSEQQSTVEKSLEECDCTIDALNDNENYLNSISAKQKEIKIRHEKQTDEMTAKTGMLQQEAVSKRDEVKRILLEEDQVRAQLDEMKQVLEMKQKESNRSSNEKMYGLKKYQEIGLRFEKSQGESIKFIFNNVFSSDPSRECYFLMQVDDNDIYRLLDCSPKVPDSVCAQLLATLNVDNDIGLFAVQMRRLFARSV